MKIEKENKRKDENYPSFIRSLGSSAGARGGLIDEALKSLRIHDFGPLTKDVNSLFKRINTRVDKKKSWDYVVLQDRSGGPLEEPESFARHAQLLDAEIGKQGAKTVFFLTWANRSRPETQAVLTDAYITTAHRLHAALAPVGLAWNAVRRIDPDIELYHRDERHASPMGSYLAACVFYSVLFKTSPEGLTGYFYHKGKMWVDLKKDRASLLQKIAWETASNS